MIEPSKNYDVQALVLIFGAAPYTVEQSDGLCGTSLSIAEETGGLPEKAHRPQNGARGD
jgi:hypothetical protein